jgi:very-short-patch-repair endonuclease
VLDFYCARARLAIEVDGISHDMGAHPQRDVRRNVWLKERGITLLRIPARDLTTIDEIADAIIRMAAEKL